MEKRESYFSLSAPPNLSSPLVTPWFHSTCSFTVLGGTRCYSKGKKHSIVKERHQTFQCSCMCTLSINEAFPRPPTLCEAGTLILTEVRKSTSLSMKGKRFPTLTFFLDTISYFCTILSLKTRHNHFGSENFIYVSTHLCVHTRKWEAKFRVISSFGDMSGDGSFLSEFSFGDIFSSFKAILGMYKKELKCLPTHTIRNTYLTCQEAIAWLFSNKTTPQRQRCFMVCS